MNKTMIAAIVVVIAVVAAALIMGYDASQDGNGGETIPTDGNDEVFQDPVVDDPLTGSVVKTGDMSWDEVTFTAVPADGYTFDRWIHTGDRTLYSTSVSITVPISDVPQLTAVFVPIEGNRVVDYRWELPQFDGDTVNVTATSPQQFTMALDSVAWGESRYDDSVQRSAKGDIIVPWNMVRDDVAVQAIVEYLEPLVTGMNDVQKAIAIMYFVQETIDYRTDISQYGVTEFWAYPMETVYSGEGDCEDTAVLFVSIASVMGLQTGLVSFEDTVMGHMSAAVYIGDAKVTGNAVFEFDGARYAFVETAVDGAVTPLGMLSSNYSILDGKWTPVTYVVEDGSFISGQTFRIGDSQPDVQYGISVWGADASFGASVSQPPEIPLHVGDSFTYTPTTSLPSTILASGSGIVGTYGGSFLTWDPETNTLSGTATVAGHYTVTLSATWTSGTLQQTATQIIDFDVTEPGSGVVSQDKELVYAAGEWNIETVVTDPVPADGNDTALLVVAGIAVLCVIGAAVVRAVL